MGKPKPEKERRNIYIALELFDFVWDEQDLEKVRGLWEGGIHLKDMAKYLKRHPIEVFALLLDQSHVGKIGKRPGDLSGFINSMKQDGLEGRI